MTLETLTDDVAALKRMVLDNFQRAELYKFRYDNLVKKYFGSSSEKRAEAAGQQLLFELPARPEPPAPEQGETPAAAEKEKKHGGGRKPLPKDLPRERIEHTLPEEKRICPCCNEIMQPFGEETASRSNTFRRS